MLFLFKRENLIPNSEVENQRVNNDFVYNSPVVISYDFVTIDFARAFVGECISLRGNK